LFVETGALEEDGSSLVVAAADAAVAFDTPSCSPWLSFALVLGGFVPGEEEAEEEATEYSSSPVVSSFVLLHVLPELIRIMQGL